MVGRNGGAFALAGSVDAGLLTLLRLTTPFSSGLVRFAKSNQRGCHYGYYPHPDTPVTCRFLQRRHGFHRTGRSLRKLCRNSDRKRRSGVTSGALRTACRRSR
ncbi:hypothetical protein EGK89_23610, partial [Salmonella enterica subsp. enterica serovar Kottbus]|nr:hypothetical protein [Salmonella enterica subsp. enterica serovar Kottbus]